MTTHQIEDRLTESEATLIAKLETWVTYLPPRERQVLALALSRASTGRADVHGHDGAGGGVTMRGSRLEDVVSRFLAPQGVKPGSMLDVRPCG